MLPDPKKPSFWVPNANVLVNVAGELVIKTELAGISKEDIEITIDGQHLKLSGQRIDPDAQGAKSLVLEVHHGRFESVVEVPNEFDLSRAKIAHQNGMLRIVVPKRSSTS